MAHYLRLLVRPGGGGAGGGEERDTITSLEKMLSL